ncbi:UMP kinase [Halovenus halobia]|uniref:UMP kinase n=1 Tax=Halovenus halobia TaxID=3396622 RepID=UPI003F5454DA
MKVIVSVGGSVLAPDVESDRVAEYGRVLRELEDAGHTVGAVVGGGPTARTYIGAARDIGANEMELDQLGIAVTRLNARLLIAALEDRAVPTPVETHERAREALRQDDIPVMGGTVPGHTTDAVGTALAEYTNADLLIYATSVSGVYEADPDTDPDAEKFDSMTAAELVDIVSDIELAAGSNAPVDLLATKLLQRSGLRAVVLDGTDPTALTRAVDGTHDGTDVVPEDEA